MSILASLAKAYDRIKDAPPFGYSAEKIGFVISLNDDGAAVSVSDLRSEDKKKSPRIMQVPQPGKKSVNISPNFLWGNTSYVLGITAKEDKKPKRLADEHVRIMVSGYNSRYSKSKSIRRSGPHSRRGSKARLIPSMTACAIITLEPIGIVGSNMSGPKQPWTWVVR